VLPSAPDLTLIGEAPRLADVRRHLRAGDTSRALKTAERLAETRRWGSERDSALMVIGMIHREAGRHNMASEAFTKVRASKGSLADLAAWYEAEQDLARGKPWVAIRECERYRDANPSGASADACLRLISKAHASMGRAGSALTAAREYDEDHELGPIEEQVQLTLGLYEAQHNPPAAISRLQELAANHDAPLTGRVAEEVLAELGSSRANDVNSLQRRAISIRDGKRTEAAWEAFAELISMSEDDADLAEWIEGQSERFGWRTRQWDFLADLYRDRYAEDKDADNAWNLYRALSRGGRFAEAGQWATDSQKAHGNSREWRYKEEDIGRMMLLAKDYAGAQAQFDRTAARGGWTGRRASFFGAFSAYMDGDLEDAIARFTKIIDKKRSYLVESRYWRANALRGLERVEEAEADEAVIRTEEPYGWYAVLLSQRQQDLPTAKPFARDGSWPGPDLPPPAQEWASPEAIGATIPVARPVPLVARLPNPGFASLSMTTLAPWVPVAAPVERSVVEVADDVHPPPSYDPSAWFDEDKARRDLRSFVNDHGEDWPELAAIQDLANAGLYDLSGPMFSAFFEEWREARRYSGKSRHHAATKIKMSSAQWRALFHVVRDHHHSARFAYGLWDNVDDPALQTEGWKLSHPLAHARYVWHHSRENGIDPYLVMGLMRQESTYNSIAVSRVNARGAMQIMPRTGHLLADLAHDVDFTAGDLEDPIMSVGYGITYLGLLMDRFEGAYPLAIASYNGGPFNVSSWLGGTTSDMPMDEWVEHIPFRETRLYVKKVSGTYAQYLALYAPDDTLVTLPPTPRGDHPEVVNF